MVRPSSFVRNALLLAIAAFVVLAATPEGQAQNLVYEPRNPAFGGSPLNYQWMLNSAQAQNPYDVRDAALRDPFADFESNLQRQILNQLARELIISRFGDFDLTQPGQFDFGTFLVDIQPGIGGVTIRIFNNLTGEETVITIPNL